jgi:hypothetical protein
LRRRQALLVLGLGVLDALLQVIHILFLENFPNNISVCDLLCSIANGTPVRRRYSFAAYQIPMDTTFAESIGVRTRELALEHEHVALHQNVGYLLADLCARHTHALTSPPIWII